MRATIHLTLNISFAFISMMVFAVADSDQSAAEPARNTVVTSDHLEMVSDKQYNYFHFTDNVEVKGEHLYASCDKMVVAVIRDSAGMNTVDSITGLGGISEITLTGNVYIVLNQREAHAENALILPAENQITLTGHPKVVDGKGIVTGEEIILRKDGPVVVKGREGERPTLVFPDFNHSAPSNPDAE